jgi:hypothetical protein
MTVKAMAIAKMTATATTINSKWQNHRGGDGNGNGNGRSDRDSGQRLYTQRNPISRKEKARKIFV